jgi:hypothetical protein
VTFRKHLFHALGSCIVAFLVYTAVNMVAIRYLDDRNGVMNGELLPNSDHWPVARQILSGQELTNFRYPPGFALYIAAAVESRERFGGTYFIWRLIQDSVSTAVTAFLIMSVVVTLTGSLWLGWSASIVLLYNVAYSAGTASDLAMASFLPWFFGGLFLLVQALRDRRKATIEGFAAGVVIAISGFIRPDILLFLPFVGALIFAWGRLWRRAGGAGCRPRVACVGRTIAVALLGFCLVSIPWMIYATVRSGSLVLYSTGFVPSHIDGMSKFPDNPVSEAFARLPHGTNSILEVVKMHTCLIRLHPAEWIALWIRKIWQPWYMSISGRWDLILGFQTLSLLLPVLAGIFLWVKDKGTDFAVVLALGVIAYFWLVTLSVLSINRYMVPAYPFLGMFAGYAAYHWLQGKRPAKKELPSSPS